MSTILSGVFRFPADRLEAARVALADMMAGCRAQDGCLACVYSQSLIDPDQFHVFQVWRDEAAFRANHDAPHFARWRAAREALGLYDRRYFLHEAGESREA